MTDVAAEREYWNGLRGGDVEANTAGVPPYDVEAVATLICSQLLPREFDRWLDLGCGTGRLTRAVTREATQTAPGLEITGVDISKTLLAQATTDPGLGGNVFYRECDGRTLPDRCGMFNAAYSVTMLQHIPHEAQRGYLFEVAAHLWPRAPFLFTVAIGSNDVFLDHQVYLPLVRDWLNDAEMDFCWLDVLDSGWLWLMARRRG